MNNLLQIELTFRSASLSFYPAVLMILKLDYSYSVRNKEEIIEEPKFTSYVHVST